MVWLIVLACFFWAGWSRSKSGFGTVDVPRPAPPINPGGPIWSTHLRLAAWATSVGLVVTSTTGGQHNSGSKHYEGLAIDVRTRDRTGAYLDACIKLARSLGIRVVDERIRPPGQAVWSGPHLHLEAGPDWGLV